MVHSGQAAPAVMLDMARGTLRRCPVETGGLFAAEVGPEVAREAFPRFDAFCWSVAAHALPAEAPVCG